MGKMLGDFGAAANAALIKVGDRLGLYKVLAAQGPMTSQAACGRERHHRTLRPRMAVGAGRQRLCRIRAGPGKVFDACPSRRWCSPTRTVPVFHGRGRRHDVAALILRRAENLGSLQDRQGRRLERALRMPVLRHRALLPHHLQASAGAGVASRRSTASSTS